VLFLLIFRKFTVLYFHVVVSMEKLSAVAGTSSGKKNAFVLLQGTKFEGRYKFMCCMIACGDILP
jgi:hypothetical protein